MAQEQTYKINEISWWGLPVGLSFIVAGFAGTYYVNQGISGVSTEIIGALAFLGLVAGIISFAVFVYSIITREVGKGESKRFIPGAD